MNDSVTRHAFTAQIEAILAKHFGKEAADVFAQSPLLGYLNHKTKAASRGSKSRGSFGNHYAIYVLVEDYLSQGFGPGGARAGTYESYEGARFTDLFRRQRELPFGQPAADRLADAARKMPQLSSAHIPTLSADRAADGNPVCCCLSD